jgi:SAM-dependent methyltransferase
MKYQLKVNKQRIFDILLYFHHKILNKLINDQIKKFDKKGNFVLELGAGNKSYKTNFKHAKVITTDLIDSNKIDEIADITNLKYDPNTFDLIICNNVFEHLSDPIKGASEVYRCLKKDGELFLVVPFLFPLHDEPFDFFRYSSEGLKVLFNKFNLVYIQNINYLFQFNKFVLYFVGVFRK